MAYRKSDELVARKQLKTTRKAYKKDGFSENVYTFLFVFRTYKTLKI